MLPRKRIDDPIFNLSSKLIYIVFKGQKLELEKKGHFAKRSVAISFDAD